jgi:hypothetical protein
VPSRDLHITSRFTRKSRIVGLLAEHSILAPRIFFLGGGGGFYIFIKFLDYRSTPTSLDILNVCEIFTQALFSTSPINYGVETRGKKKKRTSKKNVDGRCTSSYENKTVRS